MGESYRYSDAGRPLGRGFSDDKFRVLGLEFILRAEGAIQ